VYLTTKNTIEEQIQQGAQAIAIAVAHYIMEDTEAYESFIRDFVDTKSENSEYADDEYYKKMQAFFSDIKADSNVKFIYTERRINDEDIEFILDAEPMGTADHSPPGKTDTCDSTEKQIYADRIPASYTPANFEQWGWLLGAFAPIFDRNGELLGLAGVDIDAHHLSVCLNSLQMILFAIYAAIIGLVCFFLIRYSEAILEPMYKDKLTGAYTKRYAEKLIHDEISAAIKGHKDLTLMMLDLDHFKNINDTYGHGFGDKVLSSVSDVIKKSLRENDYFIRYGGEEFLAVIPSVDDKRSVEIAERIRHAVEANEIFNEVKNILVKMTVSIGVANLKDTDVSVLTFVDYADQALYDAKKTRNCVSLYVQDESASKSWVRKRTLDGF
ncbi:MAG: GGDEF domain-containing protein, partial [Planctomycetaceae bacterium]|nr:GGDEF domain-containing protein [Planctomycetaceae bacterium]